MKGAYFCFSELGNPRGGIGLCCSTYLSAAVVRILEFWKKPAASST